MNDPQFNVKIAKHKEFNDTKYDGTIHEIKKQVDILCNAKFELLPHQLFVKNFLSLQTPYNSLLLYHGLGSGKTCSAIGIAEEMRSYMKQLNINKRILIIASPNVQANFQLQLFDERKLEYIQKSGSTETDEGLWNIESCVGNSLIKEINPTNLKGLTREKVISSIKRIVNKYYVFMGYGQLTNYIYKPFKDEKNENLTKMQQKKLLVKHIRELFNNRLIIIDEVHNIRLTDDNQDKKKTALLLMKVAKYAQNLRMLLLSATPLFNSYKEIIWLTNLMNINDKRATIELGDVFDANGYFKPSQTLEDGTIIEGGRELLQRKLTGYISYVRGENPFTFPYRVYPSTFSPEHTFQNNHYPKIQLNGTPVDEPLKYIQVYLSQIGEYQLKGYNKILDIMKNKSNTQYTAYGNVRNMPTFENMESFGYAMLQNPLQALNMIYPNEKIDSESSKSPESPESVDESIITSIVGKNGLSNTMTYLEETQNYIPTRYDFEYKPEILETYGPLFSEENIGKYSAKIAEICKIIRKSKGIIMIYSQYIDGGVVPIALALEEMGFSRYGSYPNTRNLFKEGVVGKEPVDSMTMKPKSQVNSSEFRQAKYVMITGDKAFSPNNAGDIKYVTNSANKHGENVKVILISKAGAEGLDFKNIRQVHVLEPWYNMNRTEQIIGRAVRNLSHCGLPFEERNVEVYLHGSVLLNTTLDGSVLLNTTLDGSVLLNTSPDSSKVEEEEEAADLYVYRLAEKKAQQIGNVTRLLKTIAVDCILNIGQTNFTVEKLESLVENQNIKIQLSSMTEPVAFQIGDKPFTEICDYMDNCNFVCSPDANIQPQDVIMETYDNTFAQSNQTRIIERIRQLFREETPKSTNPSIPYLSHTFYEREQLINAINIVKQYPIEQIFSALSLLINNKNEYLLDAYGRMGNLIDKYDPKTDTAYYVFQPIEITDKNASIFERSVPVEYKRPSIQLAIDKTRTFTQPPTEPQKQPIVPKDVQEQPIPTTSKVGQTNYNQLVKTLEDNLSNVFHTNVLNKGEKDWYKHAGMIVHYSKNNYFEKRKTKNPDKTITTTKIEHRLPITHLRTQYNITDTMIKKYMIHHFLDSLQFSDKMIFVRHFYSERNAPKTENDISIKEYLEERIIQVNELIGMAIIKEETLILIVQNAETGDWEEADQEDYSIMASELLRFRIERTSRQMNNLLGFITLFVSKKSQAKEMVFKVKDMNEKRNNFGARIDDAGKDKVIKLLNQVIDVPTYSDENCDFISQLGLCIVLEIIMRRFTEEKRNGKYFYLTPEQTIMSEIIKKSFV